MGRHHQEQPGPSARCNDDTPRPSNGRQRERVWAKMCSNQDHRFANPPGFSPAPLGVTENSGCASLWKTWPARTGYRIVRREMANACAADWLSTHADWLSTHMEPGNLYSTPASVVIFGREPYLRAFFGIFVPKMLKIARGRRVRVLGSRQLVDGFRWSPRSCRNPTSCFGPGNPAPDGVGAACWCCRKRLERMGIYENHRSASPAGAQGPYRFAVSWVQLGCGASRHPLDPAVGLDLSRRNRSNQP